MKIFIKRLWFISTIVIGVVYFFSLLWLPIWLMTGCTGFSVTGRWMNKAAIKSDVDL